MTFSTDNKNRILRIPPDEILTSPHQTRKVFDAAALKELAASMEQVGLLQPITVRRKGTQAYELIAGERRLRAAKQLGWKEIDARIVDVPQINAALLTIIENLQRENLNFFEEAESYRLLMQEYGLSQDQIAMRIGKRQSTISNKLRLLRIPKALQTYALENGLSERHVRTVLRLQTDKAMEEVLEKAAENHWTVKEIEDYVSKLLANTLPKGSKPQPAPAASGEETCFGAIAETCRGIRRSGIPIQMRRQNTENGVLIEIFLPKEASDVSRETSDAAGLPF